MVPLLDAPAVPCELGANEPLGFVFPIYGWSLPDIVRTFLQRLRIEGYNHQYVYFAVTCGDDVGVADRPIRRVLADAGLHLDAGYSGCMPDSYVCLPGFDVDKPDEREEKYSAFGPRVKEIAEQVKRRAVVMDIKRGRFPWLKTNVLGWYFRKYLITDKPFRTTDDCIGCGKCVSVCPLHNITLEGQESRVKGQEFNIQWHGHCTGCLSCYHHCPTRSIRFGKRTEKKGQYLYPERRQL